MKLATGSTSWFKAEPRTPKEHEVFTVMTVNAEGATIFLPDPRQSSTIHLRDAAACGVLEELAGSARRRLLEMEIAALPKGGLDGQPGAAGAPVGAAGEAGPRPRAPD